MQVVGTVTLQLVEAQFMPGGAQVSVVAVAHLDVVRSFTTEGNLQGGHARLWSIPVHSAPQTAIDVHFKQAVVRIRGHEQVQRSAPNRPWIKVYFLPDWNLSMGGTTAVSLLLSLVLTL